MYDMLYGGIDCNHTHKHTQQQLSYFEIFSLVCECVCLHPGESLQLEILWLDNFSILLCMYFVIFAWKFWSLYLLVLRWHFSYSLSLTWFLALHNNKFPDIFFFNFFFFHFDFILFAYSHWLNSSEPEKKEGKKSNHFVFIFCLLSLTHWNERRSKKKLYCSVVSLAWNAWKYFHIWNSKQNDFIDTHYSL